MSIPPTAEKRKKVPRTYDIFEDQIAWLDNSSLNKSKKIRELLDNFINEIDATVIYNLGTEIIALDLGKKNLEKEIKDLERIMANLDDEYDKEIQKLMATIESQKSVIVALGEKQ